MKRDLSLGDLNADPKEAMVLFVVGNDYPLNNYIKELKEVDSPDKLINFCKRWNKVWRIKFHKNVEMSKEEEYIVTNNFNAKEVYKKILKNREPNAPFNFRSKNDRISANILVPAIFLMSTGVSKAVGIPFSVALFKLCESYMTPEQMAMFF